MGPVPREAVPPAADVDANAPPEPPLATNKEEPKVVFPPAPPSELEDEVPEPPPPPPPPTILTLIYRGVVGELGRVYVPEPDVNF
jgi:hypothetical protein